MKKLIRKPKILLILGFLALAVLLSGCVKKSDATYFLRGLANSYQITYAEGDRSNFVSDDIVLDNEFRGAQVEWSSSHPEIISKAGVVKLPSDDTKVELTAVFSVEKTKVSHKYVVNVVSSDTILNYYYNNAFNLVLLLETRNNDNNYLNAKEAFNLVNPEHKDYNSLKERFLTQEKIRMLDSDIGHLEVNLNTSDYNQIISKLNLLPETNNFVVGYYQRLNLLTDYLEIGDQVMATIDNKTELNYDDVLPLVEVIPLGRTVRKPMLDKLELVRQYLDHVEALTNHTVTQEELESIVLLDLANTTIKSTEYEALYSLYEENQVLLNDADPERLTYINQKLDLLESSFTPYNLLVTSLLIDNYNGSDLDELLARLNIIVLVNDVTLENITNALDANELVVSEEVKNSNLEIIEDYEKVYELILLKAELDDILREDFDLESVVSKFEEAALIGQDLVLDSNISWYNQSFDTYQAIYSVYLAYQEIINSDFELVEEKIPLNGGESLSNEEPSGAEYTNEEPSNAEYTTRIYYPLIDAIVAAKTIVASRPLSNEENKKISVALHALIRNIVFEKANELIAENEVEPTDNNRVLLGQLINQAGGNDYQLVQIRAYKDELDTQIRLKTSTSLVTKIILIFIAIIIFLVLQAMTSDYASKKGYEGLVYSLIALIPIGGFIYFYKKPKRRNISKSGIQQVYKPREIISKVLIYGQIVLVSVIVLIPIIYIFGMAFSNMQTDIPNTIWPREPNWNAFNFLLTETKFKQWWLNTVMIALINMLIGTVLITGAAYVFARFSFKGKKAGLLTILVLQSFPSFMGLIAMYVLFWKFGLLGRPIYLTILYIGGGIPGNIWLIKGFMDQIPKDLDESAMIDGANKLQIFIRIIMPLAIPILTFVAVGMFMAPWMDYMLPGYLLNVPRAGMGTNPDYDITQQWTLAVGLFKFINDNNNLNYSAFAAGALIVGMPITILYMFFQKYLIEGIMAGATKG